MNHTNQYVTKYTLQRAETDDTVDYQFSHAVCVIPRIDRRYWLYINGNLVWEQKGARNLVILKSEYTSKGVEFEISGAMQDTRPLLFNLVFVKDAVTGNWVLKN
jgi:hypothetical protein